jgi:hypothetical protein
MQFGLPGLAFNIADSTDGDIEPLVARLESLCAVLHQLVICLTFLHREERTTSGTAEFFKLLGISS